MSAAGHIAIGFVAGWWLGGIAMYLDERRLRRRERERERRMDS